MDPSTYPAASGDAIESTARKRGPLPLHPFFVGAFPVLFLYAQNVNEVATGEVWVPLAAAVGLAAALLLIARLTLRDWLRAALITSFLLLLFFSYGHVAEVLRGTRIAGVLIGRDRYLVLGWAMLGLLGVILAVRARKRVADLTRILNVTTAALLAVSLVTIGQGKWGSSVAPIELGGDVTPAATPGRTQRDVYFIVLDRYAGERTLREAYGFDNGPFLQSLRDKGFFIADQSRANYPNTAHSLAATMNLDYLHPLSNDVPDAAEATWGPVYSLVRENKVASFFKVAGYRYVHVGSWWEPTRSSAAADVVYQYDPLSEFTRVLYSTTLVWPLAKRLGIASSRLDPRTVEWKRVPYQFSKLAEARRYEGPTFVFGHLLVPHEPYLFNRDGTFVSRDQEESRSTVTNYIEQLRYTNDRIGELVSTLLSGPPETHPIIIIQADEGPPGLPVADPGPPLGPGWLHGTPDQLRQKFRILSAYYFPGVSKTGLYPSISPVNDFRLLLNTYFGTKLPLLPDEAWVWQDEEHLYTFLPISRYLEEPTQRDPPDG
ncbi:MAG TPA: sulfatase-like hydrolase/transferase [Actinomycetota bacterium]|nr:sulfatase-like hydrolase/transferase [Actinomycetota bacterium]